MISQRPVQVLEITQTPPEAANHISWRHSVAALPNTNGDPLKCQPRRREPEVHNLDAVALLFPAMKSRQLALSAKRTLKGEVLPCFGEAIELAEHETGSGSRGQFRPKRRETDGDQVSIHKTHNATVSRQKLARKRSFPRPVGARRASAPPPTGSAAPSGPTAAMATAKGCGRPGLGAWI